MDYLKKQVYENTELSKGIYKLSVKGDFQAKPGQFYMLRAWNSEPLLSRPISISNITSSKIEFIYQTIGRGTSILQGLESGNNIEMLGPLGNGFDIENIRGKIAVVTGGIGIAPMVYTIKELRNCSIDLYAGFRSQAYLAEELKKYCGNVFIASEDGSEGYKGYVTDLFKASDYDMVLCCGPEPMMIKIIKQCKENSVPLLVSMEKHMACGIGACLVCTCKTKDGNKRTCKDGPVFSGDELEI